MSIASKQSTRHAPVRGASHIYKSLRADGRWSFEVRHPRNSQGQRLYEVVGPRLDQAKARAREVYDESAPRVLNVGLTLDEIVKSWRQTRELKPRSIESYEGIISRHIQPRWGRTKVRDIESHAIVAWLGGLKRQDGREGDLASGTKRLCLAVLDVVLSHAVEIGALGQNPAKAIPRKRKPKPGESRRRILTPDEETKLLAYCAPFAWLRPIIIVALGEALRMGEAAGLNWHDVDFAAGKLHVRHSLGRDGSLGSPKGNRSAVIELTPAARRALAEMWLAAGKPAAGLVFKNTLGGARQLRDVGRAYEKARDRAGLPVTDDGPVTFHALRHTAISRLANHPGIPITRVRDFARHANIETTMSYVHRIESAEVTAAIGEALAGAV